jgi:hypothetical protein
MPFASLDLGGREHEHTNSANQRFGLYKSCATIALPASSACNDFTENWADARAASCFRGQEIAVGPEVRSGKRDTTACEHRAFAEQDEVIELREGFSRRLYKRLFQVR